MLKCRHTTNVTNDVMSFRMFGILEKQSGRRRSVVALIAVVVLGLTAAVIGRHWLKPRDPLLGWGYCQQNLLFIDSAKQQWALENRKTKDDLPPTMEDLRPYVGRGAENRLPACPCGGTFIVGRLDVLPKCSLRREEHTRDRYNRYMW